MPAVLVMSYAVISYGPVRTMTVCEVQEVSSYPHPFTWYTFPDVLSAQAWIDAVRESNRKAS